MSCAVGGVVYLHVSRAADVLTITASHNIV